LLEIMWANRLTENFAFTQHSPTIERKDLIRSLAGDDGRFMLWEIAPVADN
jgi:hypothetical protein